jgi:glutamate N-acetyltransferase/amino-acid N-acetyltransferase
VNGFEVVRRGARVEFEDAVVRAALSASTVELIVELGVGLASATAFGCDLSRGYVDENAAYYSS